MVDFALPSVLQKTVMKQFVIAGVVLIGAGAVFYYSPEAASYLSVYHRDGAGEVAAFLKGVSKCGVLLMGVGVVVAMAGLLRRR